MQDDRNEADRILGEDWMDPRHVLLQKALETHEQRELIRERQQETDASGQRICSGARSRRTAGSRSGCARGPRRFDGRPPIRVGSWPEKEAELDPLARGQAIVDEHDDFPR
jgi:hypothetical protein